MSDPVGLIGGAGGPGGARSLSGAHSPGAPAGVGGVGGASFKESLLESLKEVDRLQAEATQAAEDLQTGARQDVEGVIAATQKADLAFKMLLSVRNKVVQAYEEVKQIRV